MLCSWYGSKQHVLTNVDCNASDWGTIDISTAKTHPRGWEISWCSER